MGDYGIHSATSYVTDRCLCHAFNFNLHNFFYYYSFIYFSMIVFLFRNMAQNNILTEQASLIITHDLEYVLFLYLIRLIFQFDSDHFHRKVSIKKKYKQKNVWYTFQLLKYPVFFFDASSFRKTETMFSK